MVPYAKKHGWPLEAEKGKEMDFLFRASGESTVLPTSSFRPTEADFSLVASKIVREKICVVFSTTFVVIC